MNGIKFKLNELVLLDNSKIIKISLIEIIAEKINNLSCKINFLTIHIFVNVSE